MTKLNQYLKGSMDILKIDLKEFAHQEFKTYNLSGFNIDSGKAQGHILEEMIEELEDVNGEDTINFRVKKFGGEGIFPQDFTDRMFTLGPGKKTLCGIRHFGGDKDTPFVDMKFNFEVTGQDQVLGLYQKVRHHFDKFNPKLIRFWNNKKTDIGFFGSIYLVATAGDIPKRVFEGADFELTIEKVTGDTYYEWFKNGYAEFHEDRPDLKEKVSCNEKSIMDQSLNQGLLYYGVINGERMGLIAGLNSPFLGRPGIYFNEIFISRKWRGKRLAQILQSKFIHEVCEKDDFVWGTIDYHNKPSLKTALSNGRLKVRYECFINLRE